MKLLLTSDTHERHGALFTDGYPEADVFVHAGDFSMMGEPHYVSLFNEWLGELPYKHKVVIPGNHELTFDPLKNPYFLEARAKITNAILLINDSCIIDGVKFYGMPDTPEFFNWAFNRTAEEMKLACSLIHRDTDILITHGPPHGVLDNVWRAEKDYQTGRVRRYQERVGCRSLAQRVAEIKPKVHVFGHIHCGYGLENHDGTVYANASFVDERYRPANLPFVVEI